MSAPKRILVFGASGHLGRPLAERVLREENGPALRLATSAPDEVAKLEAQFPNAEVVVANYLDLPSMIAAFEGVDAAFVLSPDLAIDEHHAMSNVVAAAYNAGTTPHIVRMTGAMFGVEDISDLPDWMRARYGSGVQYQIARAILNNSGLPISYVNSVSYFMDDLFLATTINALVDRQAFAFPFDRWANFIDTDDLGEAAANLLLAPHERIHDGFIYHLSGTESMKLSEVPAVMSKVLGIEISYEDDEERFAAEAFGDIEEHFGEGTAEYFMEYYRHEQRESPMFMVTDQLPRLLGRPARSLEQWLEAHKADFVEAGLKIKR